MIQEEVRDVTFDVRLVLSNLTVSVFVVDKSVSLVMDFLFFGAGWLLQIMEKISKGLLARQVLENGILLLDGL